MHIASFGIQSFVTRNNFVLTKFVLEQFVLIKICPRTICSNNICPRTICPNKICPRTVCSNKSCPGTLFVLGLLSIPIESPSNRSVFTPFPTSSTSWASPSIFCHFPQKELCRLPYMNIHKWPKHEIESKFRALSESFCNFDSPLLRPTRGAFQITNCCFRPWAMIMMISWRLVFNIGSFCVPDVLCYAYF